MGVTHREHSRDVENVPEPRRPHQGGGSGRRKRLPSRSTRPTARLAQGDGSLIRTESKWGRSARLLTTPAAQRPDNNPIGRRGAKLAKRDEDTSHQKVWEPEVVERGAPSSGGSRQDGPSGPEIRLESTKKKKNAVGQEKSLPMRTHVPETEESESDASDEPGLKEDPPHLMARPPSDLEGDQEAAEPDQEEVRGGGGRNHRPN